MVQVTFLIEGSAAEPYEVTFIKKGAQLSAFCTCRAGTYGDACKHRISILAGDAGSVVSRNAGEVATVRDWFAGSHLESALTAMLEAEKAAEKAKRELSKAKKALASAMHA